MIGYVANFRDEHPEAPVEEVVEEEVQVQTPLSDTEVEAMFVERAG